MSEIRCYFPAAGGDGAIRGSATTRWGWVWLCVRGRRSQRWLCRLRLMRVEVMDARPAGDEEGTHKSDATDFIERHGGRPSRETCYGWMDADGDVAATLEIESDHPTYIATLCIVRDNGMAGGIRVYRDDAREIIRLLTGALGEFSAGDEGGTGR